MFKQQTTITIEAAIIYEPKTIIPLSKRQMQQNS